MHGGEVAGTTATRLLSAHSSSYLIPIDSDNKSFVLIDAGMDAAAQEILAVLRHKGADASAVKAIFLTHGHVDHTSGIRQFPDADVYVGEGDNHFVEGTAPGDGPLNKLIGKKPDLAIADATKLHVVQDGQTITIGSVTVRAFAVPGHTHGSLVFLIDGVLYAGDTVSFTKKDKASKPPAPASFDLKLALASLAGLLQRFDDEGTTVTLVVPSHSAEGTVDAVRELVGKA